METKLFNNRSTAPAATQMWRVGAVACVLAVTVFLGACGGSGAKSTGAIDTTELNGDPPSQSADQAAFSATLHKELKDYCKSCHGANPVGGAPAFAQEDVETAYAVLNDSNKVDKLSPEKSRIVVKVAQEKHGCWSDCISNGSYRRVAPRSM